MVTSPRKTSRSRTDLVPTHWPDEEEHRRMLAEALFVLTERESLRGTQVVSKTAAYTMNDDDMMILADASGGDFTVTLLTAKGRENRRIIIKNTGASGTVTVDGDGTETIDGATTATLTSQYDAMELVSDGTNWHKLDDSAATATTADVQTFTTVGSDDWNKPSTGSIVLVECWGGGGSGGRFSAGTGGGGGGGGGYNSALFAIGDLGGTETVTIGAGGAAVTTANTDGNVGGNTTFGTHLTAYGGGAGEGQSDAGGGGGGGALSAGAAGQATGTGAGGGPGGSAANGSNSGAGGGGGGLSDSVGGASNTGGGGGGGGSLTAGQAGGNSVFGGAGGGAGGGTSGASGGTSSFGGNGGAGSTGGTAGTAGTQPGGGGGGSETGNSGAGGAGQCRVTTW